MAFYRMTGGGKFTSGSFVRDSTNKNQLYEVKLGFTPTYFACWKVNTSSPASATTQCNLYSSEISPTKVLWMSGYTTVATFYNIPQTTAVNRINHIQDSSVFMHLVNDNGIGTWYYVAVG